MSAVNYILTTGEFWLKSPQNANRILHNFVVNVFVLPSEKTDLSVFSPWQLPRAATSASHLINSPFSFLVQK